ncbi:putative DnaJ domain-containing protein [Lupinus albus]|uniref:Putative DnaJ domain-containing protein n=1 Tax=Lupinus albus TaxID=3870 RepID=A0A6A4PJU5_LUPAL|nr:putative DnaJ domain-containing protein [Lupinus albus]
MDGNKDDALKCFKIGKQALESGDRNRALKFLTKARRLDPTLPVDDLFSTLENDVSPFQTASPTPDTRSGKSSPKHSDQPSIRRRASTTTESSSSSSSVTYTEEQVAVVRDIRRKKNYYEILGLEKSCSVEDVRKAYRKLSLKVHPDKNKAPGAEEAFKAVSKAFQCLSDEENRKKYGISGEDESVFERGVARTRGHHHHHHHGGFYAGDVDAEEIFRNFFFGGMAPATTNFGGFSFGHGVGARQGGEQGPGGFNVRALIQLLPVFLVLLLNFLPSSEPVYSLSRSYPYEHRFTTPQGVNYYVKSSKFDEDYPLHGPKRRSIEDSVEREYFSILRQNCRLEMQRRQWGYIQETPHCDMLRKFNSIT